jgi:acetyl esterase/lipase
VVRDQWLAALVLGDEREKAVFDLVPLARPRRQMTDSHRRVREIANGVGATVIFVDYVNAPEAKYPTQQEQAYASLLYTVEHADELRVDPTRLAIVGDSVGGHMAAIVTLMAKRRGGPNIRFQVLFYPAEGAGAPTEHRGTETPRPEVSVPRTLCRSGIEVDVVRHPRGEGPCADVPAFADEIRNHPVRLALLN